MKFSWSLVATTSALMVTLLAYQNCSRFSAGGDGGGASLATDQIISEAGSGSLIIDATAYDEKQTLVLGRNSISIFDSENPVAAKVLVDLSSARVERVMAHPDLARVSVIMSEGISRRNFLRVYSFPDGAILYSSPLFAANKSDCLRWTTSPNRLVCPIASEANLDVRLGVIDVSKLAIKYMQTPMGYEFSSFSKSSSIFNPQFLLPKEDKIVFQAYERGTGKGALYLFSESAANKIDSAFTYDFLGTGSAVGTVNAYQAVSASDQAVLMPDQTCLGMTYPTDGTEEYGTATIRAPGFIQKSSVCTPAGMLVSKRSAKTEPWRWNICGSPTSCRVIGSNDDVPIVDFYGQLVANRSKLLSFARTSDGQVFLQQINLADGAIQNLRIGNWNPYDGVQMMDTVAVFTEGRTFKSSDKNGDSYVKRIRVYDLKSGQMAALPLIPSTGYSSIYFQRHAVVGGVHYFARHLAIGGKWTIQVAGTDGSLSSFEGSIFFGGEPEDSSLFYSASNQGQIFSYDFASKASVKVADYGALVVSEYRRFGAVTYVRGSNPSNGASFLELSDAKGLLHTASITGSVSPAFIKKTGAILYFDASPAANYSVRLVDPETRSSRIVMNCTAQCSPLWSYASDVGQVFIVGPNVISEAGVRYALSGPLGVGLGADGNVRGGYLSKKEVRNGDGIISTTLYRLNLASKEETPVETFTGNNIASLAVGDSYVKYASDPDLRRITISGPTVSAFQVDAGSPLSLGGKLIYSTLNSEGLTTIETLDVATGVRTTLASSNEDQFTIYTPSSDIGKIFVVRTKRSTGVTTGEIISIP